MQLDERKRAFSVSPKAVLVLIMLFHTTF